MRFPWKVCSFLAAVGYLTILNPSLRADTVAFAPDGSALCFGQTILRVVLVDSLSPERVDCLLMGSITGRPIVAPVNQNVQSTANKLYFVDLIGDGRAKFSFLPQDIIEVSGVTLKTLIDRSSAFDLPRGQFLEWKKVDSNQSMVLHTTGYSSILRSFTFVDRKDDGLNSKLRATEIYRMPSGFDNLYINQLDVLDLGAFTKSEGARFPRCLMIWAKPEAQTGFDNLQLTAPDRLLVTTLGGGKIKVHSVSHLPYRAKSRRVADRSDQWENVVGGALVGPDESGRLCYFNTVSKGEFRVSKPGFFNPGGFPLFFAESRQTVYGIPIQWNAEKEQVELGSRFELTNYFVDNPDRNFISDNEMGAFYRKYNSENAGTQAFFADEKLKIRPSGGDGRSGSKEVGRVTLAEKAELNVINENARIVTNPDFSSERSRAIAENIGNGVKILGVIYGYPFVASPTGSEDSLGQAGYTNERGKLLLKTDEASYAFSAETTVGGKSAVENVYSAKLALKTAYSKAYSTARTESLEVKISSSVKAGDSRSVAEFFEHGTILSTRVKPVVRGLAMVSRLDSERTALRVPGTEEKFVLSLSIVGYSQENASRVESTDFELSDPARLDFPASYHDEKGTFQTQYSVLSDGLSPRPAMRSSNLIIAKDNDELIRKLRQLEQDQEAIGHRLTLRKLAETTNSGVTPYIARNGDNLNGGVFSGTFKDTNQFIVNLLDSKITSSKSSVSTSLVWEAGGTFFFNEGAISFQYDGSEIYQSDSTSGFEFTKPGNRIYQPSFQTNLAVYAIDIPKLKAYLSNPTTETPPQRPGFVPKYAWENDQSFILFLPFVKL